MLIECCSQERSYLRFYGLLGQVRLRLTMSELSGWQFELSVSPPSAFLPVEPSLGGAVRHCFSGNSTYLIYHCIIASIELQYKTSCITSLISLQYATVHRLETNKLRNVAKFFAQLFYADALPWTCMSCIHLNEEETNSSRWVGTGWLVSDLTETLHVGCS